MIDNLPYILAAHMKWTKSQAGGACANLSCVNLCGANLCGADLRDANLWGANLSRANLRDANLRGAALWDANLRDANLWGADLSTANLIRADLSDANLRDANLSRADLSGADLWGANLSRANLRGANWGDPAITSELPIIQINGLLWPVMILDAHAKVGCKMRPLSEWKDLTQSEVLMRHGANTMRFFVESRDALLALARATGRKC